MPNISNSTENSNITVNADDSDDGVRFVCCDCHDYVTPDDHVPLSCDMCDEEHVLCEDCHPGELRAAQSGCASRAGSRVQPDVPASGGS